MPTRGKRAGLVASVIVCALVACSRVAGVSSRAPNAREVEREAEVSPQPTDYHDGHARPRALAFNPDDGLLYAALSTADAVAVVDPSAAPPRLLAEVDACRFPDALAALPGGGALVACRFEPGLVRVAATRARLSRVDDSPRGRGRARAASRCRPTARSRTSRHLRPGARGRVARGRRRRADDPDGPLAARAARRARGRLAGEPRALLLVSSFVERRVTVHPIDEHGRLGPALQTIATEAPVLDLDRRGRRAGAPPPTHEDRALSRARGPVEGLDSGVLRLPRARRVGRAHRSRTRVPRGAASST